MQCKHDKIVILMLSAKHRTITMAGRCASGVGLRSTLNRPATDTDQVGLFNFGRLGKTPAQSMTLFGLPYARFFEYPTTICFVGWNEIRRPEHLSPGLLLPAFLPIRISWTLASLSRSE